MLTVPAKQLDDLALAIRRTVMQLTTSNGLKVQGPGIHGPHADENTRRAALLALHSICGQPVWPADTVALDGYPAPFTHPAGTAG